MSRAIIGQIMDIVRFAPTGHNRQDVHWLIIHETREMRRFTGMAVDWMHDTAASGSPLAERFHMNARVEAWKQGAIPSVALRRIWLWLMSMRGIPLPGRMPSSPWHIWRSSRLPSALAPAGVGFLSWP